MADLPRRYIHILLFPTAVRGVDISGYADEREKENNKLHIGLSLTLMKAQIIHFEQTPGLYSNSSFIMQSPKTKLIHTDGE